METNPADDILNTRISFRPTKDCEQIKRIVTNSKIYRHIMDDDCPPADQWEPQNISSHLYLLVEEDGEEVGLFIFVPHNSVTAEIHTCLMPCLWGKKALKAADMLADWVWKNTKWERIITNVPRYNRLAFHFAQRAGMKVYGINKRSFRKFGILQDQILLGASKCL